MSPQWTALLVCGGLAALAGCRFDGGRADAYRCQAGACPQGLLCVDGLCVAPVDGGPDAGGTDASPFDGHMQDGGEADRLLHDGPADDAKEEDAAQQDAAQQDAVQQDAAQQDAAQQDAGPGCVSDPLTADLGHFTAVHTASSWQFGSSGYEQVLVNDLHDTWVAGAGGDHVSIRVTVAVTAEGKAQFDSPTGNFASAAGVIVRASGLSDTSVTGYLCGVDTRNDRLILGRMSGAYSPTHGVITILGETAMTANPGTAYVVSAEAQGSTITCSSGTHQIVRTDASVPSGSVGLFTIGATARFRDGQYCVP